MRPYHILRSHIVYFKVGKFSLKLSALSITGEKVTPKYDMAAQHSATLASSMVTTVKKFSKLIPWVTKKCLAIKINIINMLDIDQYMSFELERDPQVSDFRVRCYGQVVEIEKEFCFIFQVQIKVEIENGDSNCVDVEVFYL